MSEALDTAVCACGRLATANGRECVRCFQDRVRSVANLYHPSDSRTSGGGVTANRRWDRRLERYADAKRQGVQPQSTRSRDIDAALAISDKVGAAFRADAASLAATG